MILDELTGRMVDCQIYKCRSKSFRKYAGIIMCKKHFEQEFNKDNYKNKEKFDKLNEALSKAFK